MRDRVKPIDMATASTHISTIEYVYHYVFTHFTTTGDYRWSPFYSHEHAHVSVTLFTTRNSFLLPCDASPNCHLGWMDVFLCNPVHGAAHMRRAGECSLMPLDWKRCSHWSGEKLSRCLELWKYWAVDPTQEEVLCVAFAIGSLALIQYIQFQWQFSYGRSTSTSYS